MHSKQTRLEAGSDLSLTVQAPSKARPSPSKGGSGERIYGVFSTEIVSTVGTGATKRKVTKNALWFIEESISEDGDRVIEVRPLNDKHVPYGDKKTIGMEEFLKEYRSEIEHYQEYVFPTMKELDRLLTRAEKKRDQGALYSAQLGFEEALEFDLQNVRANFGLGLTYMARADMNKADDIFRRVVCLDAAFAPEHKHLFNEFGISLRKSRLFDQAVEYYFRALEFSDDDENLYYNIARAHYERGDRDDCRGYLEKALDLNPEFDSAGQFMEFLEGKGPGPDVSDD